MSVILGSILGAPFCFARFDRVVEKALELEGKVGLRRKPLEVSARERNDWRRGLRSRDMLV
jgi:hypothetical protein